MALKHYRYNGGTYKFEESEAPEGAEEINATKKAAPKEAAAPKNKARKAPAKKKS